VPAHQGADEVQGVLVGLTVHPQPGDVTGFPGRPSADCCLDLVVLRRVHGLDVWAARADWLHLTAVVLYRVA